MSLYRVEAIALKHFPLGERDKIVTFFTRERGKLRAVANNVRHMRSNLSGTVELFTHSRLLIYQGKSLARINKCQLMESFISLREDLKRMAYASYISELVHEFSQEEDRNEGLFLLLLATMHLLVEREEAQLAVITRIFELRALGLLGFQPLLEECAHCGQGLIEEKTAGFSFSQGGVICRQCKGELRDKLHPLSAGSLKMMKRLIRADYRRLNVLKLPAYAANELKSLLSGYLEYSLERELKSKKFLDLMEQE